MPVLSSLKQMESQSKPRPARRHVSPNTPAKPVPLPAHPQFTTPTHDSPRDFRTRIVQIASQHFFAHGFNTVRMDDLARELGMSKKTLYHHFPSKEHLLTAVLQGKASDIRQTLERITQGPALNYADKLRAVITALARKLAEIQPVFVYSLKRYAPAQFRYVDNLRRQNFSQIFSRLLKEGIDHGEIRPDADIPFTIELILGAFNTMVNADALNRLQLTPGTAMQMTLDLMFDGLLLRKKH